MAAPINTADSADLAFERSREEDRELVRDDLAQRRVNDELAQAAADPDVLRAQELMAAQSVGTTDEPAIEPAAEAPTQEEGEVTPEEGGEDVSTTADVAKGVVRGPLAELADIVDNLDDYITPTLRKIMPDFVHVNSAGESMGLSDGASIRAEVNKEFGTPETVAGELAQGMSGQLAYIIPAFRAVKGASALANWGKLTAVSATVAGATQGEDEGNLSNLATGAGKGTIFDNWVTQGLSIDEDDTTFERIMKTAVEDLALSFVADAGIEAIKGSLRAVRGVRKAAPEIANAAQRSGVIPDNDIAQLADDVVVAKADRDMKAAAVDNLNQGKAAREFEVGDPDAAPSALENAVDSASGKIDAHARTELEKADARLIEVDAKLREASEATDADGRFLEAYRQVASSSLTRETDAALGTAATRNMPEAPSPPTRSMLGNFLEADEGTATLIRKSIEADDVQGLERALGGVYDSTNYDRIAGEDGVRQLLEANAIVGGNAPLSTRVQREIGLAETEEQAEELVQKLAEESGGSVEGIIGALDQMMPNLTNFRAKFNALRKTEVGLANKVRSIIDSAGTDSWGELQRAEFVRWSTLLANVNDLRSGIISEIGGTLSANRIHASAGGFDDLLAGARAARDENLTDIVRRGGGAGRIDELAQLTKLAAEAGTDSLISAAAKAKRAFTLGDVLYESYIMNILSSPATQTINITSNAGRGIVWEPTKRLFEASALAVTQGDLAGFSAARAHVEGLVAGLTGVFKFNARLGRSQFAEAFARGARITGRKGGLFTEAIPQDSLLRSGALGDLVRRGVPVHVPGSNLVKTGGVQVPLMGFVPQNARDRVVDFAGKHLGPVAKGVDYMGRAMGWVGKTLAAADEVFASMSYRAQLHADTVEAAIGKGLKGTELAEEVARLRRHVGDLPLLKERMDPKNPAAVEYLRELDELQTNATKFAQRATFASGGTDGLASIELLRQSYPSIRWFAPFIKTPLNLASQGVTDFSPLGPAFQAVAAAAKGDKKELSKALGRFTMTGGIFAGAWSLIQNGQMTGGGPHNPAERDIWLQANQPYSVKIGETWYSYNRFDPVAMPLGILADALYLQGRAGMEKEDKLQQEIIGVLMEAVKSRTFLNGISEVFDLIENPGGRNFNRIVGSKVHNTLIPGSRMWASLEKGGLPLPADLILGEEVEGEESLLSDFVRGRKEKVSVDSTRGFTVQLGSSVAGDLPAGMSEGFVALWNRVLSEEMALAVTPQRDFYGDVRNSPDGMGPDFITPFTIAEEGEDPLSDELARMGYGFSIRQRFGSIYGLDLDPEQQDKFHMLFVKPTKDSLDIREHLSRVILNEDRTGPSEGWSRLGDGFGDAKGGKQQELDKIIGRRMKVARKLMRRDPVIAEAYRQELRAEKLARSQAGTEKLREENQQSITPLLQATE